MELARVAPSLLEACEATEEKSAWAHSPLCGVHLITRFLWSLYALKQILFFGKDWKWVNSVINSHFRDRFGSLEFKHGGFWVAIVQLIHAAISWFPGLGFTRTNGYRRVEHFTNFQIIQVVPINMGIQWRIRCRLFK